MRSMLLTMLLCWTAPGSAGADDTAALIACQRGVEHCELREAGLRADLAAVTAQRDEADAAARDLAERLALALEERDSAEQGARTRAVWSWSLGVAGTVLEAGAVAVLLAGGSRDLAAVLAGVGAASAAGGITVAVW